MTASIETSEEGGVRYLHFGSRWIQGAMRMAPWIQREPKWRYRTPPSSLISMEVVIQQESRGASHKPDIMLSIPIIDWTTRGPLTKLGTVSNFIPNILQPNGDRRNPWPSPIHLLEKS